MGRLGFYFNQDNCIGCRTCQIACKDRNNLMPGELFRKVQTFETGAYPASGLYHYSGACNHCADAKCVKGCPTGAMYYAADGTVQHDDDKCIGCQYCSWNCPYGAPQFLEEYGIVKKCDSCKELRDGGDNPVCVDACPMRVLEFGDLDKLIEKHVAEKSTNNLSILPNSSITRPSLLIKPRQCAQDKYYFEKKEV